MGFVGPGAPAHVRGAGRGLRADREGLRRGRERRAVLGGRRHARPRPARAQGARRLPDPARAARRATARRSRSRRPRSSRACKDAAAAEGLFMAPEGGACVAALRKLKASGPPERRRHGRGLQHRHRLQVRRQHGPALVSGDRPASTATTPTSWSSRRASPARREHEGRPALVLDRTAFYAESGGQPWDTGTLGGVRACVAVIERRRARSCTSLGRAPRGADARARARGRAAPPRPPPAAPRPAPALARVRGDRAARATVSFHLGARESARSTSTARSTTPQVRRPRRAPTRSSGRRAPVSVRTVTARRGRRPGRARTRRGRRLGAHRRGGGLRPPGLRRHASRAARPRSAWCWCSATSATRAARACASSAAIARWPRSTRAWRRCERLGASLSAALAGAAGSGRPRSSTRRRRPRQAEPGAAGARAGGRGASAARAARRAAGRRRARSSTAATGRTLRVLADRIVALRPCVALLASRERQGPARVRAVGRPSGTTCRAAARRSLADRGRPRWRPGRPGAGRRRADRRASTRPCLERLRGPAARGPAPA